MSTTLFYRRIFLACIFIFAIHSCCSAEQSAGATPDPPQFPYHVWNIYKQPFFLDVVFASVLGWVIGMVKGFSGSKDWLQKYSLNPPVFIVLILDFLIFVCAGGYLGTGIYNPQSILAAIAAGVTWPVGLGAIVTK